MALSARANARPARDCCHGPINLATTGVPIERRSGVPFECRLTIGCKVAEAGFGTCSRPRLKPTSRGFAADHCDGTYTAQRGRSDRCPPTEAGIEYWRY